MADFADATAPLNLYCGDLLTEPDPLIRYQALCGEQSRHEALVSRIKAERGRALAELRGAGLTLEQVADAVGLGTRQRAEKLIKAGL